MLIDKFLNLNKKSYNWPSWINRIKLGGLFRRIITWCCNYHIILFSRFNAKAYTLLGNNNSEIIVSLTTFPNRINSVWITIESLIRQSVKPQKIILWLSKDQFPTIDSLPRELLEQQKRGLEISFVDGDLRSHKKFYYVFRQYPNNPVVLVDDDLIYNSMLIEELLEGFNRRKIHLSYGYRLKRSSEGNVEPYNKWIFLKDKAKGNDLFFGSGGGTLLIPNALYADCLKKDLFCTLCPTADDIWLNAMARLGDVKLEKVRVFDSVPVRIRNNECLASTNVLQSANDIQIANVNEYYQLALGEKIF